MSEMVLWEIRNGVGHIVLNQPDQGNVISTPMAHALAAVVQQARRADIGAVLISATGKQFCVGGDIREFVQNREQLPQLIKESAPVATAPASAGMFATPSSAIRPRSFNEPTEAITYRMAKTDQQVLDELVSKWGATSRGHLIGCALDHYFAHHHTEE